MYMSSVSTFMYPPGICLTLLFACLRLTISATLIPAPIVVPASQYWEGSDGPWSTFQLRVGTPPQDVRVMVGTNSPDTWVVLQDACNNTTCGDSRGKLFNYKQSTSWKDQGIFNLFLESNLNYTGNGRYGLDTVGLTISNSKGPTLNGQVVAALVTPQFYYGLLGLNTQPTNFTNFNNPIPSFFNTLKDQNLIPSLSWSYTAGNQYSLKRVLGSLIFGGYDTSKFKPNSVSFNFAPDSTRDLVVGVQSIVASDPSGKTRELLSSGIFAFIDSTVPYIYLPIEACRQFEILFGLQYDDAAGLYLISEALHSNLVSRNTSFTFTLGNTVSGGDTVQIVLPYAAFDLNAGPPLINNGTAHYFPLKRADNSTQYTLGRTFLQEAYLIADYERSNFSVSQCVFDETAKENVVTIHATNYVPPLSNITSGTNESTSASTSNLSISPGGIAGVIIAVVGVILVLMILFAYRYRKWPFNTRALPRAAELDGEASGNEVDGNATIGQKVPAGDMHEADSKGKGYSEAELEAGRIDRKSELAGGPFNDSQAARTSRPSPWTDTVAEVEGSGPYQELVGSPVPIAYYDSKAAVPSNILQSPIRTESPNAGVVKNDDSTLVENSSHIV